MSKQFHEMVDNPFSQMNGEQLLAFIRERRKSRSISRPSSPKTRSAKAKPVAKTIKIINNLSAEDKAILLAALEE